MEEKIFELIGEIMGVDDSSIGRETFASDIESWTSLNHLRLITAIEEEFGVRFSMDEIQSMENVGDLVKLVRSKVGS